jgi:hypothetical protein
MMIWILLRALTGHPLLRTRVEREMMRSRPQLFLGRWKVEMSFPLPPALWYRQDAEDPWHVGLSCGTRYVGFGFLYKLIRFVSDDLIWWFSWFDMLCELCFWNYIFTWLFMLCELYFCDDYFIKFTDLWYLHRIWNVRCILDSDFTHHEI